MSLVKRKLKKFCPSKPPLEGLFIYMRENNIENKVKTIEEVLAHKKQVEHLCGIYFLIKGDEIVYIGQTTVGESRIHQHKTARKIDFDSYAFFECDRNDLNMAEYANIEAHNPRFNKNKRPPASHCISISTMKEKLRKMGFDAYKPDIRKMARDISEGWSIGNEYYSYSVFDKIVDIYKQKQPNYNQVAKNRERARKLWDEQKFAEMNNYLVESNKVHAANMAMACLSKDEILELAGRM